MYRRVLLAVVLAGAVTAPVLPAQNRSGGPDGKGPFKPFGELIEDAEVREGFFTTYQTADNLYLAIPQDRLGQDFLMSFEIARGIGASRLFGGTMLDIPEGRVVALERHGNAVYLVQKPHRFPAEEGTSAAEVVDLTFGASVLESAKIESVREDSAVVIDVQGWVLSDLSDVSSRVRTAVSGRGGQPGRASFDKARSFVESVKAFPENLNIRAKLTFKPAEPVDISSVPDDRYIPISISYSLAALPQDPMAPREADDRVGYFMTVHKDFTHEENGFFRRYVNKWRLECASDVQDGLCEPKKPITYYIDRTVPEQYRQAMIEGVEEFNAAFEAAGFRNAIRAELLPDDADAEDIRYATLRWNVSNQPGYGAIGPSVVDPRTGEILDADMLFEANMVLGWKRFWRSNIDPVSALEEMFDASPEGLAALAAGGEMVTMAAEISAQGSMLRAALIARGDLEAGDPVPEEFVHEALKRVTMHEVGHTLGLRHNFRSSTDTPFERLHDRAWAEEHGLASSVMEYPGINVAPPGTPNGYFYTPTVGSYDRWAIAYGYTPDPTRAAELARRAAEPGHAYGTDEDARGSGALDPTVSIYDLSDQPMAWGRQRAALIRGIWEDLPAHILTDNAPYSDVTDAYRTLLTQYARALGTAVKYIGGQYQYRDHVGDPNERGPFVAVSRAQQVEALDFLTASAFSDAAFRIAPEILQQFGASRWRHWGESLTVDGRIDYPLHEQIASVQRSLLERVTEPMVLARIRDAEVKFGASNVLTIPEVFEQVTQTVWSEAWSAPGSNVPSTRRDLQRAHLDRMIAFLVDAPERTPADAQAVARMQLEDLDRRLARRLSPPFAFDAYTLAHLRESRVRIARALEASLRIEP